MPVAEFGLLQTPSFVATRQADRGVLHLWMEKKGRAGGNTWSRICLGRSTDTWVRGVKIQEGFSAKKALSWENPLAMRLHRMGGEPTLRKACCLISLPAFFLRADLCQAYSQFKGTHTSKTSSESCTISSRLRIHTQAEGHLSLGSFHGLIAKAFLYF